MRTVHFTTGIRCPRFAAQQLTADSVTRELEEFRERFERNLWKSLGCPAYLVGEPSTQNRDAGVRLADKVIQ